MRSFSSLRRVSALVVLALSSQMTFAQNALDPGLSTYRPPSQLKGNIRLVGSSTMSQVAAAWAESFNGFHPDVKIEIEVLGSANAVKSVMSGSATFGLLSRTVHDEEVEQFTKQLGAPPHILTPAMERMAIYVHPDNPVRSLTLAQVGDIFSGKATKWGDVGVGGAWANQPINLHGRGETTGSRVFLEQGVFRGLSTDDDATEHKNNFDLVKAVSEDRRGIGYAGSIYGRATVKPVPLARDASSDPVHISSVLADQGQYPLMRPLQLVVHKQPGKELPAVQKAFLQYAFSASGQVDVVKSGFQPISARPAEVALEQLNLRSVQ